MENICLPFHLFTYRRSVSRWLPTREQPNDEISFRDAFPRLAKLKASAPPVRFGQDIGRPPYFRYPRPNASDRERENRRSDVDKMAEIGHYPWCRRYRWSSDHRAADEPNQIGRGEGAV